MKWIDTIKKVLKQHGHHLIFGMSILSLTLLVAWWSVFLQQSIKLQRSFLQENLELALESFAFQLGNDKNDPPQPGVLKQDDRFEITACGSVDRQFAKALTPSWKEYCIQARDSALAQIEDEFRRKRFMLIGESGFLVLLILLSSILLYQFIQLEKSSAREVEAFWGRVTHEIKTPITGIKAFLQSLKNQSLDPDQVLPFVDMALKQVEKQEQLVENILAGYGLRSGGSEHVPKLKDLNLNECIKNYFDRHVIHLTDAKLSLRFDADNGKELMVRADSHILRVILDNIVDNALKYCSPGLILTVGVSGRDKEAVVTLKDNGPGFPSEFPEKIFSAYKYLQDELPGKGHGSGMGLYIARQLTEKMNGRLEAFSKGEGCGAEFHIYLNLSKR